VVARAGTLLIPSGPANNADLKHLHIVCTDPCAKGLQLVVSITSWTNNLCDNACILDVGDHDFIRRQSWIMYRKARLEESSTLDNGVEQGIFIPRKPVRGDVFERVAAGICQSQQTPRKIKQYYGCFAFPAPQDADTE
jgi:hypothetical protein